MDFFFFHFVFSQSLSLSLHHLPVKDAAAAADLVFISFLLQCPDRRIPPYIREEGVRKGGLAVSPKINK